MGVILSSVWEVLFTDEFGTWFGKLDDAQQDAVIARVGLLETEGPPSAARPSTRSWAHGTRT